MIFTYCSVTTIILQETHVVTCEQMIMAQHAIGIESVCQFYQVLAIQTLPLDDRIRAVIAQLDAVDGIHLQP